MSSDGHQQKTHVAIQLRKHYIVAIVRPGNYHPDSNQSPSEYGSGADSRKLLGYNNYDHAYQTVIIIISSTY